MKSNESLGPKPDRCHTMGDEDLRAKLVDAVTSGDRDRVFELAAALVVQTHTDDRMLSLRAVAERVNVSPRTIGRRLADEAEQFPRPVHVGQQCRWIADEVAAYVEKLKANRN
jgi:predicted DNA-binding transcriptional regulator AlpA